MKSKKVFTKKKSTVLWIVIAVLLWVVCICPVSVLATEQVYYYHNDHLGSPVAITDAFGNVVWRADYEPFGKIASLTETTPVNVHRFIGKERDLETGLDYFGARYYDAGIGRFLSVDPFFPRNGLMSHNVIICMPTV